MAEPTQSTLDMIRLRLKRRYRAERRFQWYGRLAIGTALLFLGLLTVSVFMIGFGGFFQARIALDISFDPAVIEDPAQQGDARFARGDYERLVKNALSAYFPDVTNRRDKRRLYAIVSTGSGMLLRQYIIDHPDQLGTTQRVWLLADDEADQYIRGKVDPDTPETARRFKDQEIAWIETLRAAGRVEVRFNTNFFTSGDSREPEMAGVWGAIVGSFFILAVTFLLSFPIGVAAAVYLEEFAPRNRFTDLIEININNLAAVPSIVFGLLGLAVFIGFFGVPRSAALVGGLVLTLMTLPTIIIASRAALAAVPPSIREAALGVGASRMQMVFHHVVPLAMPGMLTGAIIGMAGALGESAPLLMVGMVAFLVDIPAGPLDPATALPVQIYLWVDSPERAFIERTAAAIIVLLAFLVAMNALAVYLRKRFERRW